MNERERKLVEILGKRFVADFRVVAYGPGDKALLLMYGDKYELSTDELLIIIERGLVTEAPGS